ncbi:MAG: FAD-dependent oxidoreductase [Bifidobacteriaceae bacterium]|jgi:succinate dehydrogenase/fumarate reductase flavoprotein subunit|nr:FAD-dependent oxidoreductase [Bifidobacteriaceae bacterium]
MEQDISRRSFLGIAAAGAATAVGAVGLSACTDSDASSPGATPISSVGIPETWDYEADFVVVGAGTSLTGALKAVADGMSCICLEARDVPGGTTSLSGGSVWIPCNDYAQDDAAAAKIYMTKVADGLSTEAIIDNYIAYASEMINFITEKAGVQWAIADRTDYHEQWEGATRAVRTVKPIVDAATGQTGNGSGYTQPQAEAFTALGGTMLLKTTAEKLIARPLEDGRQEVLGVVATEDGKTINVKANKGVLLGAGGFDYNEEMKAQYLDIPSPCTFMVETCDGKGILMAQGVGAELAMMCYGWGNAAYKVIGDEAYAKRAVDASIAPLCYQSDTSSMWINRYGRRFCDEAASYDSFWYGFGNGRDTTGEMAYTNIPAWYVCDQGNRNRNAGGDGVATPDSGGNIWGVEAKAEPPEWVFQADTLEELAAKMGLDELSTENFIAQVERFNKYAAEGTDPEFHRGESTFDQGGPGRPADCLEPMNTPPYYAAVIVPFLQGTKGGPKTNEFGQVLHANGDIVPRLYACGNNAGCGTPGKYYNGAGGTVAPGMIFAYLSAIDAAKLDSWA